MSARAPARPLAGLLLAAGRSARMARRNKLLIEYDGQAMVRHAARALCEAELAPVIAVIGHQGDALEAALSGLGLRFVRNPDPAAGMGASLACGIRALPAGTPGVVVALADMPRLRAVHLRPLLDAFDPAAGAAICRPVHAGRPGHPVIFAARFFGELAGLSGDRGARALIARHADLLRLVPAESDAVVFDVDTESEAGIEPAGAPGATGSS